MATEAVWRRNKEENHTRYGVKKKIKKKIKKTTPGMVCEENKEGKQATENKEMKKTKKTTTVDEKQKIVDDFIKRVNPYKKPQPIAFDLRGYAAYIEEHGEATPEIMESFRK